MNFETILRKLNAIGGVQGVAEQQVAVKQETANEDIVNVLKGLQAIQEGEGKCPECGKVHEGECAVEESKKPDADKDGIPDWADKDEDKEEVKEAEGEKCADCGHVHEGACKEEVEEGVMDKVKAFGKKALDTLGHPDDEEMIKDLQRKAGVPVTGKKPEKPGQTSESISECGEVELSPMTVVGGEPQMGVNPAMPAEVPTIGAQPEAEPEVAQAQPEVPKATYTLSIQNGENNLQMTTDVPDEIIHIMKLAGVNKGAQVTQKPSDGEEQKTDEAFGNTPAQTNEPNPRLQGDIYDWGQKGTGRAPDGSGTNKPAGQGDNPLREALDMILEYRKYKSDK